MTPLDHTFTNGAGRQVSVVEIYLNKRGTLEKAERRATGALYGLAADTTEQSDVICHKAGCDQAEALDFRKRWLAGSGDRCGGQEAALHGSICCGAALMIPTLRVEIIGCSRQLASCPATAARALTSTLPLCPPQH
ncbi:hypothetical protein MRX96_000253 [Rhipicephalus microplus]